MERRGELVNSKDFWVTVGDLEVPASIIVEIARHQIGPGLQAHEQLKAMGAITPEEDRRFMARIEAARGVVEDLGPLFPEGGSPHVP